MSGTKTGAKLAGRTNKQRYGENYYKVIGSIGGKKSRGGGFGQGEEGRARASKWGKVGGAASRRGK